MKGEFKIMKKSKTEKKKISLKTQMIVSFLCVGIIPLVIFAIVSSIIIKSSMYNSEIMSLKQISSMVTANLDNWGDENIVLVEDIASSQVIYSNNLDNINSDLKNKQGQNTDISNLMYIDIYGNVLADALGSKNVNISNEDYFEGVATNYSYVSNVLFDKDKGFPYIIFSSPIKTNNEVIGYIVSKIKTSSIEDSIGNIFYSENGEIFTFNYDGFITYHSNLDKVMSENIFDSSSALSEGARKAIDGNFNSINYNSNGEKGAAVYNFIPSLKWGTITTTPNSEIYQGFNKVLLYSIPSIIIILLLILGSAFYVLKLITTPISKMVSIIKNVAHGDLTIQCELNGAREIVTIGEDLNEMVRSLKNLVLSISNKSIELEDASVALDELASAAEETSKDISKAMDEIAGGSVSQAEKTDDVLNHVRTLDEKMTILSHKIQETNEALKISDSALSKGNASTTKLKVNAEEQYKLVGQAVNEVNELSDFVSNIDEIIETISEIAEQTSLLSLNASIEAARAGENGKGFAVVAEEVGKLASESQSATRKTSDILNRIKAKADSTTGIMNSINDGMMSHSSTVNESIDIFKEITSADYKISENVKSFSGLIDYIKDFSDELLELIETLASSAEEDAAVAEEVTASSNEQISVVEKVKESGNNILKIVDELKSNIEKFNIEK